MASTLITAIFLCANISGRVVVSKDGRSKTDHSNVVVSLEGVPNAKPTAHNGTPPTIIQRELAFVPEVNVVTVGQTIEFPNEDKIFHNVFSVSEPAKFDLGLYKSGEKKAVTFTKPGVVDVYCNIHPQMVAKIKVLDTKFFAITRSDGSFNITNVPPGKYTVAAWQAFGDEAKQEVTVTGADGGDLQFQLSEGNKSKRHNRKDGTPYGRYK